MSSNLEPEAARMEQLAAAFNRHLCASLIALVPCRTVSV